MTDSTATTKGHPARARILVVDDHADTLYTTGRLLRLSGYDVRTAGASAEAARLCERHTFDVMIVDVRLGDGDGIELLKRVRQHCDVRGIVVSGSESQEHTRAAAECGACYLLKPVSFDRLLAAVEAAANRHP